MKIDNLIKALQSVKAEYGNLDVLVSVDPEGNSYGDLGKVLNFDLINKALLVFPEHNIYADELDAATK